MKRDYQIDLYEGHLIIIDNWKILLLDTGSPVSLTKMEEFEFMGQTFRGTRSIGGRGIDTVSGYLRRNIDVLVGMDVLGRFTFEVDYRNKILTVNDDPSFVYRGSVVNIGKAFMGTLTIPAVVEGKQYTFALDTGAKISYINHTLTVSDTPVEQRPDFNPLFGYFTTFIYPKIVEIGSKQFECKFGNLPAMAENPLSMVGIDGVIGYDLFEAFKVVLDFGKGLLILPEE